MWVGRNNFDEVYPDIVESIDKCTFLAIDLEFTGLFLSKDDQSLFDSLEKRYEKMKYCVQRFIPCQFGLSIYTKDGDQNRYNTKSYSFFSFPETQGNDIKNITVDIEAMEFLAAHDFDFNKLLYDGLPYLNAEQEAACRKKLYNGDRIELPISFAEEINETSLKIEDWVKKTKQNIKRDASFIHLRKDLEKISHFKPTSPQPSKSKNATSSNKTNGTCIKTPDSCPWGTDSIDLESAARPKMEVDFQSISINQFTHYLILRELRERFPSVWIVRDQSKFKIYWVTSEEREKLVSATFENEIESLINSCLGLTKVIRAMIAAHKPIVGNNMMFDLVMFFQHFIEPLPVTLKDFRGKILEYFPAVYDVKSIVFNMKKDCLDVEDFLESRDLFSLYRNLKDPEFMVKTKFQPSIFKEKSEEKKEDEIERPHDAGFDAYMTGYTFVRIATLIATKVNWNDGPVDWPDIQAALVPFRYKVNLIRAAFHFMDLAAENQDRVRPFWLVLSPRNNFEKLTEDEVEDLLAKFERPEYRKINDRQYLVAVSSFRTVRDILQRFREDKNYKIAKYNKFQHSPTVRKALWAGFIFCSTLSTFLVSAIWRY
ncbi:pre-piRNA 3'-exonuclease trimmer-like [Brevipalpus obovatus]|uniref:pre-piRNA 3'-exonuclease trimmer-like n=1 Tax=Brevipalpus obovatus TaxID=246614 RepID=UPI003D9EAF29